MLYTVLIVIHCVIQYIYTNHSLLITVHHIGANLTLLINSSLSSEDGSFWAELVLNNEEQQLYTKLFNDLQLVYY